MILQHFLEWCHFVNLVCNQSLLICHYSNYSSGKLTVGKQKFLSSLVANKRKVIDLFGVPLSAPCAETEAP